MTEDTDERMERASRIRNMREGQREADDDEDDEDGAGVDAAESQSDDGTAGEEAVADEVEDDTGAASTVASEDSDEAAAETTAGGSDQSGTDVDAAAAAQRAAEAAAQVSGGVTGESAPAQAATADGTAETQAEVGAGANAEPEQPAAGEAAPMSGPTGVELPEEESIQAAIADEVVESDPEEVAAEPATGRGAAAEEQATAEDTVRVLEFTLGDEHYCLDIAHVEEIVKRDSITRVPNTPAYVEGVVDLRGQITTILDPKLLLDIDQDGSESLLVVFAPDAFEDQGAIGWVVDEVRQVAPIVKSEVSAAPVDADYIEGVIDREGEDDLVIWTNPEMAIRLATGEREVEE